MTDRSPPIVGAPPRLAPLPIQMHQFDNGLLLAVVERRDLPMVDVELVIRAGAALDDPHKTGRAVMTAEMLDEGTSTRSVLQIADEVDYLGAHLSISAGWDTTMLSLHVLSGRLHDALDVFADVVLHPSFPEEEFERKKRERLTALLQDRDEPRVIANKALARGVFGQSHPYGNPAGGTYESLSNLKLHDVRGFYEQYFKPEAAYMVVVGDVELDAVVATIGRHFETWRGSPAPKRPVAPIELLGQTQVLLVDKPRAAQAEIRVGHVAPARSTPDYFPLVVMNTILGGAFTSRLNLRLREEMAVTYGASSKFGWRTQGGIFWAGSAVDSYAAAESVSVTLREMSRLREERLDTEELQRAMQYIAFGLPRSFETTEDVAAHLREQLLHGFGNDYWPNYVDQILEVTAEQVRDVAARHLHPERAVAVVVADRGDVEAALTSLDIGDVVITEVEA